MGKSNLNRNKGNQVVLCSTGEFSNGQTDRTVYDLSNSWPVYKRNTC